jgi:hypothetical protein
MPAKLTLHPPQRAPRFIVIRDGETLEVGRDAVCGLVLEDSRVSKRHALLGWTGSGWAVEDLGSKNGTTVNGQPVSRAELADGDWVSFGGLLARFQRLTAAQAATLDTDRLARIQTSAELRRRLTADLEPYDLLLRFLQSAMEVTGAERGFVLVAGPDEALRVEVASGFASEDARDERFAGSVGAVRRAVEEGGPVIVSDALADPRLGKRPSVASQALRALACFPLRHEGRVLGILYVDSRKPSAGFTELDVELLEALADHTAVVLATLQLDRKLQRLLRPATDGVAELQARFDGLLPAR